MKLKPAPLGYIEYYYEQDTEDSKRYPKETKFYLQYLKNVRGRNVLNVGCGPQFYDYCMFFGRMPQEYTGIDINKSNLDFLKNSTNPRLARARKAAEKNNIKIKLIHGDIFRFRQNFAGKFDAIVAVGVLGIFSKSDFQRLMNILIRYMQTGGILVDIGWNESCLSQKEFNRKIEYRFVHPEGPDIEEELAMMERAGFRILKEDMLDVKKKKDYGWGKIHVHILKKK